MAEGRHDTSVFGTLVGQVQYPSTSRPRLTMNHVDGPLLTFRDGQMHWLTLRERWRVWRGKDDALSLERKLRPDLSK